MNDKIKILELVSLTNGNADAILPNFPLSDEPFTEPKSKKRKLECIRLPVKNKRKFQGMKAQQLRFYLQKDVIKFCQDYGLIATSVTCDCGKPMRLAPRIDRDEGCEWSCRLGDHQRKQTVRKGTLFEKSKISIPEILWIAYMWVHEYSYISMMHECDHSSTTLIEWCMCCADLCQAILERKCDPLGGDKKQVEVFECKYTNNTKSGKSSAVEKCKKWVFCALEQFSTKSLLITVDDKKSETLVNIFDKYILPGTTVISHVWSPYKEISNDAYEYLTKEKLISFYDSVIKSRMGTFKEFLEVTERPPPGLNHWTKFEYDSRFCEYMYRKSLSFAPDAYLSFLKDISLIYKPSDKIGKALSDENAA